MDSEIILSCWSRLTVVSVTSSKKSRKLLTRINRKLSLRKHFDAEVERWIAEMRQQIELVNESVASAKDALEVNSGIQASAKSRIEELENEVELYKEIAVKHSAVDTDKNELSTPSSPEPWSPSHTPTSLSPVPETIHLDHSTVSNSLSLLPSPRSFISRFTMPRWTVPIFIYTVLIWNGGAAYGTLSMQSMMEAFAPLLYASGIIPTPSLFEGNAMREGYYGPGTPPIESCTPMTFLTGLFEGGGGQDLPPPL
ncbi:hypothetical protein BC829DRAFT_84464 [Chytridium lagenaria]|nr:hypothetical protein BC829DRAFT_84464 [Chytridium lagenaria]